MEPRAFAVTMGMDAFRIAIGIPPRNHTLPDIIRWLTLMASSPSSAGHPEKDKTP